MAQVFTISDGSTTIDLLNPIGNYHLASWETAVNQWKNGGIFSSSDLSNGSIPVFRAFENSEEKITIHITGTTHDTVIANLRSLISILDNSVQFFITEGSDGAQAYLAIKADNETNTRYAVITSYKIESLPEQFNGPFVTGGSQSGIKLNNIYANLELIITRGVYLENPPGQPVSINLDSLVTYNNNTFGVNNSNVIPVFVTDYRTTANITHIYRYDASSNTYSSNLAGSTLHTLFPSNVAAGDMLYIGISSSVPDSGRFFNLIFNITTASSDITYDTPQIWRPSVWQNVSNYDEANNFSRIGSSVYSFNRNNGVNWQPTSINGVSAYWIRFRVYSVGSSPTIPVQSDIAIYTSTTPYIDCIDDSIDGDISAISKIDFGINYRPTNIIMGTRKYERGSNFTSYINFSDAQNPSGINISPASGSYVDDLNSPSGRAILISLGGGSSSSTTASVITFNETIANQFIGTYRAFIRLFRTDVIGSGYPTLQIEVVNPGGSYFRTEEVPSNSAYDSLAGSHSFLEILDFGNISLPSSHFKASSTISEFKLNIYLRNYHPTTSAGLRLYDLVLIPVDESYVDIRIPQNYPNVPNTFTEHILLDRTESPERDSYGEIIDYSSNVSIIPSLVIGDIYLDKYRQRIWFFAYNETSLGTHILYMCDGVITFKTLVSKINRYIFPRGNI